MTFVLSMCCPYRKIVCNHMRSKVGSAYRFRKRYDPFRTHRMYRLIATHLGSSPIVIIFDSLMQRPTRHILHVDATNIRSLNTLSDGTTKLKGGCCNASQSLCWGWHHERVLICRSVHFMRTERFWAWWWAVGSRSFLCFTECRIRCLIQWRRSGCLRVARSAVAAMTKFGSYKFVRLYSSQSGKD